MRLLIDNCSLLRLVHSEGYSSYLTELEHLVSSGAVVLLTHPVILAEWAKHKKGDKNRKLKKLLGPTKGIRIGPAPSEPSMLPMNHQHLDLQYEQVEKLLSQAELLTTPEVIKNEFADRYSKRLAPFHNKLDSLNDWEIVGSAGHYCEQNGIAKLFFVSGNSGEFGSPENLDKQIHPDIKTRFPNVKIAYFSEISFFLQDVEQLNSPADLLNWKVVKNERYSYQASLRKNELDGLYNLFENMYGEIAFVPPHLLKKYYPFSNGTKSYTYYSLFSMHQVPEGLIEMVKRLKIDGDQIEVLDEPAFADIKEYRDKLKAVLGRLSSNLIY